MQSLRLLICEDEKLIADSISNEINTYFKRRKINIELNVFTNSVEAQKFLLNNIMDAVFLDIEMEQVNGIELAKNIRSISINTQIIFITGYKKYQNYVFSFHVFDYIIKPILASDILNLLEELMLYIGNNLKENIQRELIKTNYGIMSFDIQSIVCFEKVNRKVILHLSDGKKYSTNNTIKMLTNQFTKYQEFFKPHKAFLINLKFIRIYHKCESNIEMVNGVKVPLSQLKSKSFRDTYIQLIGSREIN